MSDMRLIVAGAGGRMGRTVIQAIAAERGTTLAGAVDAPGASVIGLDAGELAGLAKNGIVVTDKIEPLLDAADGLIDFTVPRATVGFAELVARKGLVHVIGTTGLGAADEAAIAAASKRAVIVKSGNMSLGVNLLAALVERVARTLDAEFDIEIVEMHHNRKVDAPSGTALMLGRAAAAEHQGGARGRIDLAVVVHLHDLDVELGIERARHALDQGSQQIDAETHIAGFDDDGALGGGRDGGLVGRAETGRA